ncbi:centrosomal protein of 131 kDa [Tachyglossus aculeatus]|uniref:centrosomal protein of 131 kDa n=1 Tax=Tachyglossus aculeatus TaxID=9261 RepID=UPI0018F34245|nr:centrosomal protein of 131 kDa [Tachyglossus aculeatus]
MKGSRGGGLPGSGVDLSLTGLQLAFSRRPGGLAPPRPIARSVSVTAGNQPARNQLEGAGLAGSRAINNLRRSNSATHVNDGLSMEQPEELLAFFDSGARGRKELSPVYPEKRTTWNVLDDQPRVSPVVPSARRAGPVDSPVGMKKKETGVALAANFTANNRSNKGAMGNCVTTMVHNYLTTDRMHPPKSSLKTFSGCPSLLASPSVLPLGATREPWEQQGSHGQLCDHHGPQQLFDCRQDAPAQELLENLQWLPISLGIAFPPTSRSNKGAMGNCVTTMVLNYLTADRTSNKGAMGNCVTTMVHNNYSTADRTLPPKSSLKTFSGCPLLLDAPAQELLENLQWLPITLGITFPLASRSNKGAMGNCVTTMVHNNYSTANRTPPPKSSNQAAPSLNNLVKATSREEAESGGSCRKSRKNLSRGGGGGGGIGDAAPNNADGPAGPPRRKEVTEEEAERFIRRVNQAAVTIQRWYRLRVEQRRAGVASLNRLLAAKREEWRRRALPQVEDLLERRRRGEEERRRIREEKARQARRAAIQELQQKRAQKAAGQAKPPPQAARDREEEEEDDDDEPGPPRESRKMGKRKTKNGSPAPGAVKVNNADAGFQARDPEEAFSPAPDPKPQDASPREPVAAPAGGGPSKGPLEELLDTLKMLEEEPDPPPHPKAAKKDRYAWIDGEEEEEEEEGPNSLTADNLERFGKLNRLPGGGAGGALLSEAKLQSIISFLDEMDESERERPRSAASAPRREGLPSEEDQLAHLEQASAVAAEVTSSVLRLKQEVEEKKRAIALLQTALAQQRELTVRQAKDTEKQLSHQLQLQKEQYDAALQRHQAFIDQLIEDKRVLSAKCQEVVAELKEVEQKYTRKIGQVEERHQLELKKLKELMSATEKIRREKWIDEKTKKIKEITVRGLEPEIRKLMARHQGEVKKLKALHEAELSRADERAAQRYGQQARELRAHLEREKEQEGQRERERARQRYEKCLEQEEQALQNQRRRLYGEVAEEKERLAQQAARQRAELEELRRRLEENGSLLSRTLREEYRKGEEEQERRHQVELTALKEQLQVERQAWEVNSVKKEEAWMQARERELREEVRKGRDKEIELVIQRLEADVSVTKEECERAAESRVQRVRDKYEAELAELEGSERKLQERCTDLKGRLGQAQGEAERLRALVSQKEEEAEDVRRVKDRLEAERNNLAEVIRQEFADGLVAAEEENRQLKADMARLRARQRLDLEQVARAKQLELEEVHRRVKSAIGRKEETVNTLRKQYEAAVKRADHLEALLDQQKKQLLSDG